MMALATASTYLWKERGMVVGSTEAGIDKERVGMDGTGLRQDSYQGIDSGIYRRDG